VVVDVDNDDEVELVGMALAAEELARSFAMILAKWLLRGSDFTPSTGMIVTARHSGQGMVVLRAEFRTSNRIVTTMRRQVSHVERRTHTHTQTERERDHGQRDWMIETIPMPKMQR
jgi:hypothetical protein